MTTIETYTVAFRPVCEADATPWVVLTACGEIWDEAPTRAEAQRMAVDAAESDEFDRLQEELQDMVAGADLDTLRRLSRAVFLEFTI